VSQVLEKLRAIDGDAWLVGGAVRDQLLGRDTGDFDLAVSGDPERFARAIGRAAGGHPFALSETFGGWRVVARRGGGWQVDVLPLAGGRIEDDLARRDLTINAIAQPLGGGDYVDPFGGRADLAAGVLRMVSSAAFDDDPLRSLRLCRLACELGFEADPTTIAAAARSAPGLAAVSPERIFVELKRVMAADRAVSGLRLMDATGVTAFVLPEFSELKGVEQSRFHHLDVHDHTLAVVEQAIVLHRDPASVLGQHGPAVAEVLAEDLADGLTRGEALRFGALLHDIAKPQTREVKEDGRITFMGHDVAGAELAREVLRRLRASERLGEHVAALARHHLRLGFLVHEMPLPRRTVYTYLQTTAPVAVDVTVLSVADRLATRGDGSEAAIARHVELATAIVGDALAWRVAPPQPPIRGDELAAALGIRPGPELGRVLAELSQASWAGELSGREQAIERARQLLG
jgi:putative nucleotidyltransferase with HDIG domain